MKVRKSLFAVCLVSLLFSGPSIAERAGQRAVPAPPSVADGSDPMPFPKPTRGTKIAADAAAPAVLAADGTDPMPMPRPPRRLA